MITFSVPDMHCGKCSAKIEASVQAADPTALLQFDMEARQVTIDTSDAPEDMQAAIVAAGFAATAA